MPRDPDQFDLFVSCARTDNTPHATAATPHTEFPHSTFSCNPASLISPTHLLFIRLAVLAVVAIGVAASRQSAAIPYAAKAA